jgi:hypothetical protein
MKGMTGGPRLSAREREGREGARAAGEPGKNRPGQLGCAWKGRKREREAMGQAVQGRKIRRKERKEEREMGRPKREKERKKGKFANSNVFELLI